MTVSSTIRGVLQTRAIETPGLPSARSFEGYLQNGKIFEPVKGIPHVRFTMIPTSIRTISVGNELMRHEGLFQIGLFYPVEGTKVIEDMGDAVRAKFRTGVRLVTTQNRVLIRFADRTQVLEQPDWLQLPITIGWRYYSSES